jgi:hypothetical protein
MQQLWFDEVRDGLERAIGDMEVGTYLKKLADIVSLETQVDEMYQRILEVACLLDKSAQRSWSFHAEDSPSLSDCWEQVLVEKQWENDQHGESAGHMEHDDDCCDWRGVLCMLNVCCASCT